MLVLIVVRHLLLRLTLTQPLNANEKRETFMSLTAPGLKGQYQRLAEKASALANHPTFVNFITIIIILAGVLVGMQTFEEFEDDATLNVIDAIVLGIFTFEVILKFVAEEFAPWNYFKSAWNTFDFVVVAGSFMPAAGSLVTMLRLLRLLRVLKLLKSLPQLAIIVNALIMGLSSIGFIGVILMMVFYLFAILGMILFKENDPWHFGTLHSSILTLFRCSTLEDWTDVMYINIYGCKNYGYMDDDEMIGMCKNITEYPGKGAIAAIYFIIFTLLGALVLLTLFIGVICTAMEEAQEAQDVEKALDMRIMEYSKENNLNEHTLSNYKKVFSMLDVDNGGTVEEDELRAGLKSLGRDPSTEELQEYMREVDEDDSGEIDLAEFIEFMTNMKLKNMDESDPLNTPFKRRKSREMLIIQADEHTPIQEITIQDIEELDNESITSGGENESQSQEKTGTRADSADDEFHGLDVDPQPDNAVMVEDMLTPVAAARKYGIE